MYKKLIFVFAILTSLKMNGQNANPNTQTNLKIAYQGSIVYPGIKLGIERPSKVILINKKKKDAVRTITKTKSWTYNLGFYHHPTFHDNWYLLTERQYRREQPKGLFFEFSPGLGLSRTFLGGATYKVDNAGAVTKQNLAGYNYIMLSAGLGMGYDFNKTLHKPAKLYLKSNLFFLAPYNSFVYARPTIELGVIYALPKFWKSNPKIISKTKNIRI